ncbi:MAG: DUF6398 domain-containing protein [Ardenticatenaceae bacterium]
MISKKSTSVPKKMRPKYDEIVALTDEFCAEHLNEEYAEVCRLMTAKLARKRPSPLERGRAKTWAAGITHAIGNVNFLFDRSQTPHLRVSELAKLYGVGKTTGSNKAREIKQIFNIRVFDPEWTLPSRIDRNPMVWMITVNGIIMDARSAPREVQVMAYAKGLIPYIPGDE